VKKLLLQRSSWGLILLFGMPTPAKAGAVTSQLYLSVPWGSAPAQVGHALPQKPGDESAAGPSSFAVDSQGRIGLIDIQNDRIQFWERDQRLTQTIPCGSFGRCPNGIAVDDADS
jgi:hypothetical protein